MSAADDIIAHAHAMSALCGDNQIQRIGVWVECSKQLAAALNACEQRASGRESYACPRCGAVSYNPNDVANKYCGQCHLFENP